MEIGLKKSEEQFDMSDYIDEEPVKCKNCVEGTCDRHTITKYEASPEAEYPKEISTIAADNGYIFKIGCRCEPLSREDLTNLFDHIEKETKEDYETF